MPKISTESKPLQTLEAISSLAGSDRIPVLDISTGKTGYATVDSIGTGGILDLDNTFTGANDFTGDFSLDSVAVTATAAELNKNDVSAQSETIDSGVAASVTKMYTAIDNTTTGAGAITLDVPDASMIGQIKTIEMTVDNGDVTLALTNIVGGTAATTATFDAVGETLVLVANSGKWIVLAEYGVTLS